MEINYTQVENSTSTEPEDEINSTPAETVETTNEVSGNETPYVEESVHHEVNPMEMTDEEFDKFQAEGGFDKQIPDQIQETFEEQPEEQPSQKEETQEQQYSPEDVAKWKAHYEATTAEFVANGKKHQFTDAQHLVRAAQMGLGYNKKMQELAPYKGIIRTLKESQFDSDERMQLLADVIKGDKAALNAFIKEVGIDPLDIASETEELKYQPVNLLPTQAELTFEDKGQELRSTPEGVAVLSEMNQWDDASIGAFMHTPAAFDILVEDKASGLFDTVIATIERDSAIGTMPLQFQQLPKIQLYDFIRSQLVQQQTAQVPQVQKPVTSKPSAPPVASTRRAGQAVTHQRQYTAQDILAMTDEEFARYQASGGKY